VIDFNNPRFAVEPGPDDNVLRAERFLLVDKEGRTRGMFGLDKDVPAITMFDVEGAAIFGATVEKDQAMLLLRTSEEQQFVVVIAKEQTAITINNGGSETKVMIGIVDNSPMVVVVRDGVKSFFTERGVQ
jgi:hypothetical protein